MEITETSDQSLERQHEQIEEKHRNEILNLLKSFEFEKKDMEARFREELEKNSKENGKEKYEESVDMENEKIDEHHFNPSNTNDLKSLSELETENRKLAEELNKSKDQILQMKNQIKDFTQKIEDVEKVLEDNDFPSDKKDILSQILQGPPRNTSSSHDVFESPSNSPEPHERSLDDLDTSFAASKPHRTSSVLSFQVEELNLENEDLKRNVYELEQKLRKTVEQNEVKVGVFNEKLNALVEKIMSGENSEASQESDFKLDLVEDINNIRLDKTSNELLEEYVGIVLRQKLTAPSPDILNVNFCHELQSLEQILDIEIFDGRVFDAEMKDEVKQVLRDKERELLVAYTLEKLRDEIRHRATTEDTLEELRKERERDLCVHQAANEILKVHLGVPDDNVEDGRDKDQAGSDVSQMELGTSREDNNNDAVNKILREHLGIGGDKGVHSNPLEDNGEERVESRSSCTEIESLKTEKENLERNLQELQDYFEKERQEWLEKLESRLKGDSNEPEDKDKMIESLQARTVLMEQILNTERFHLSRLYYMEMKEELEACLKENPLDRGLKVEKDRLVDAWKHHVEVGELYQEILSKETENLQNLQTNCREENASQNDEQNESPRDELSNHRFKLEQQLPMKLELLELQRKRCRDHKAASLILEQAVVALETAAQEQDTLLVSGDYFRRKSSWSSIEEAEEGSDVREKNSPQLREGEASSEDIPSTRSNVDVAVNTGRKDALADALIKAFERLLNGQEESVVAHVDSCTSDSELSEVETSSSRDVHSEDEGSTKNQDSEKLQDSSSTKSSPRTEPKTTDDPEGQSETHEDTSVPVIYKLPPRIENILNIERFNMSRLLRDEYVDKIRRGRQKLRRARAKNGEKNEELVSKFQDEVKALLEGVEVGGEVKEASPPQRRKLTATPSYDSGIADPVEQDKHDVVKKYKELLEKARRDLSRAHRALRARNTATEGSVKDEIAAMKRNVKEAKNDLEELEGKRNDLDDERGALLGKIKDAQKSESANNEEQISGEAEVSGLKPDSDIPLQSELESTQNEQLSTTNAGGEGIPDAYANGNLAVLEDGRSPEDIEDANIQRGKRGSIEELKSGANNKDVELEEMKNKIEKLCKDNANAEEEIKELQRKLVAGTGGEEVLKDLQDKLQAAKEQHSLAEQNSTDLQQELKNKEKEFSDEKTKMGEEINELQRKLVAGTGGEEILEELQGKLQEAKEQNSSLKETNSELEKELEGKDKTFADEVKPMKAEINELQRKLVAGTGGEEILQDLQKNLGEAEKNNNTLEQRISELQKEVKVNQDTFCDKEKKLEDEISSLQEKLVDGTGGEEVLAELQDKLQQAKDDRAALQMKFEELEDKAEEKNKKLNDQIKEDESEISELQKKLVDGTGGEEILAELQDKLQQAKDDRAALQMKFEELEDKAEEKNKKLNDQIKEDEREINELQKKLVSGTGGEEILTELQDKLRTSKEENAVLQAKCEELESKSREKDEELGEEIKMKENEIMDLQKKLVSGTGGEEILAELQDKLQQAKDENAALQMKCEELEDKAEERNKKLGDQITEKESEISELQKKMVSGTGGEEILTDLQDKLKEIRQEKAALQTTCDNLEDKVKEKDEEHVDEIKRQQNEITDLQKKLVSGTGGEEILAELQDKLKEAKEENMALKATCSELEKSAGTKQNDLRDDIEKKENEIQNLQKQLVSGTGGEEMLSELQNKLKIAKGKNDDLEEECSKLEECLVVKDDQLNGKIGQKDAEIFELQRKILSGSGGEEILADLQNKLKDSEKEKSRLEETCSELGKQVKSKDKELMNEKKENAERVSDLQKKLVSGTGSEEVLKELQNELKEIEMEKEMMNEKCSKLKDEAKKKDIEAKREKNKRDEEINKLQKKLLSGTGGEEILEELQEKLKKAEMENGILKEKYSELEDEVKEKDIKEKIEKAERKQEIDKLQKKLVSGTGGEEVLDELQGKLKHTEKEKEKLERTCAGLERDKEKMDQELQRKEDEVNDLQETIVAGTGAEDLLKELQKKLRDAKESEKALEKKLSESENDLQRKDERYTKQLKNKQEEINKLQRDLVAGTGAEDVLVDLQEKLARSDKETKKLEECARQRNLGDNGGTELKRLRTANEVLENENKAKQEKINELQFKLIEGTGGEELLKDLQNDLSEANETNKQLKIRNAELERVNGDLDEYGQENIIVTLKEKNERLEAVNDELTDKIENLQKDVVSGTGSEELLQELQNEMKELSCENKELRKKKREMQAISREENSGNDVKQLQKDLNRVNVEKKRLMSGNEIKDEQIADLQNKLVAGSGAEELLEDLRQEIKGLKDANQELQMQCHDLEELNKDVTDEKVKCKKLEKELFVAQKENEKLAKENESKDAEIRELQKTIIDGSGGEKLLQTLQDKIKEANEENKMLEREYAELESDTIALLEDSELLQRRLIDLAEAENEIDGLVQECKGKDRQIVELQRKLVAGTGGEEILDELQNQVEQLQERNNELEKKLAKTTKDLRVLEGLERKDKRRESVRDASHRLQRPDNLRDSGSLASRLKGENVLSRDQANNYRDSNEAFDGSLHHSDIEMADEEIDQPLTYEECLQMIPEIKEEKDYWREKYRALRQRVGGQFVDTIPDVWNEEESLAKEREEIVAQLSELRQEISEKETPAVKAVSEKERIETELSRVEDELEVCSGNLGQLRDIQNEQKLIGENEEMLMECLNELQLMDDSLEGHSKDEESNEVSVVRDGSEMAALERKREDLRNELEELLTEEQNLKDLKEKDIDCLKDEKISIENDVREIEAALQNLSTQNNLKQSRSHLNRDSEGAMDRESEGINDELEKIEHEINILQSSLETPSLSNGQEINNLLALMKEKSKLEDELAETEKSLNQLGKREYEALLKEREKHEKVAKKLLELSREKEAIEVELQEVEALALEKEGELVKSYNTELKSKEDSNTLTKKKRGFRKKKSGLELKSEDSGAVSSAEEGFSDIDLGDPALPSDAVLALNEELGPLMQKQSSLAVRLEGLGKEITAQSLKVEKSLLGVKDDPSGEASLGAGYVSVEDLTQSQMSIFDDYNMVDELSLATSIVRDERVKRKSSRKAPLSKLLKEKSLLEKKLKEFQGKVLVQNTKVKNALKEGQDGGKAKEKFVKAVEDRKSIENDLSNVSRKIDDVASEESSVKDKKAKTPKSGKSLSKNDKRRLLSQRESLSKQLDGVKTKIENFSVDGQDSGLADFPEMRETGNPGNTIERLRELIAREAALKQELDKQALNEGHDLLSRESSNLSSSTVERDGSETMLNNGGEIGIADGGNVYTKGSGMIPGDSSSLDERAEETLDSGDELGKREDKNKHTNDLGASSAPSPLGESLDNKGILKERFRDLGDQVRSANEESEREARSPTAETEVNSNTDISDEPSNPLVEIGQSGKNTTILPQTRYSKDPGLSSEKNGEKTADTPAPYSDVMDLLVKEKAKKEERLRDVEKQIEREESDGDKTKRSDPVFQRKREELKNKMKLALKELQRRKEALDESENLLKTATNEEDHEQALEDNRIALTLQKEQLEKDLAAVEDELGNQTQSEEENVSSDYQDYKNAKDREKDLAEALEKVYEKLHRRKAWTAVDSSGEEKDKKLESAYADILKRMSDENLNMADLIHEMEETKETLSKEREITGELLDLIKSRVGNELLEALMGEGLQSPSVEIREMGMFFGEGYPELLDEIENDTVTVAEVIDDYKKVNQFLFKENQKLHEKVELLKGKVDEDLLASIVNQESVDIEVSKKQEISKILENNKTLFEQIVSSQNEEILLNNMKGEIQSLRTEVEGVRKERDETLAELENLQNEKESIEDRLSLVENENNKLKESMACIEKDKEEQTFTVNDSDKAEDEIAAELKSVQDEKETLQEMTNSLERENEEMREKIRDLQSENEKISARLSGENESKNEIAKDVEDLKEGNKSLEDLLDAQKKENEKLLEDMRELQSGKDELCVKLNDADQTKQEIAENYEKKIGTLENENKELSEVILALKKENQEGMEKLDEINETIQENEERLKSLNDLELENQSIKERLGCLEKENKELGDMMASLEDENNEIIPKMERLEKLTKEQEDEIEYLRKEENDFELLNEKLKEIETDRENVREDLGVLREDMTEIEDFVQQDMNQDVGDGVISALGKYREKHEETDRQNNLLKAELERMKHIQNAVGESLSEKLLELSEEGVVLNDTQDIPRCVERVIKDKNTLSTVLNEYENDLDKVKQHLGEEVFSLVVGKDANLESGESDQSVKMTDDLRNGKYIKEIVKEYEDLINSQASDLETAKHLQDRVDVLEQELETVRKQKDDDNLTAENSLGNQNEPGGENVTPEQEKLNSGKSVKPFEAALVEDLFSATDGEDQTPKQRNPISRSSQDYQNESLMDIEYEDLLKKVIEHQAEIEEAEKLLHVQKVKHEADKQNMIEQFNAEKTNMQQMINNERGSMEKAMQNLINEIVRLKEERNEIRKNNRIEKEKLVVGFENERTQWLSGNEEMKSEIEGKLEKKFQDDLEKVKKEMTARETELKEEMVKLKDERNNLASKVSEMEDKVGDESSGGEENEKLLFSKERESNEHIKNEFEEKMKVEKKRFQETLNSLRQEIERLQKERSKAMNEISTKQEDRVKQTTTVSASEAVIYDRLESEFKTKMNSEKMFMESRIKELRKENEVLNKQKQELKSTMRTERLELSKKYEREKEELAEKYRNELKSLRKNIEKTQTSHEASAPSTQNFYELRRKIRDRDSKIQRYETFFKELNEEASILQRDSDVAM